MLPGHQVVGDSVLSDHLADRRFMYTIQLTLSRGRIRLFVVASRGHVVLLCHTKVTYIATPKSELISVMNNANLSLNKV